MTPSVYVAVAGLQRVTPACAACGKPRFYTYTHIRSRTYARVLSAADVIRLAARCIATHTQVCFAMRFDNRYAVWAPIRVSKTAYRSAFNGRVNTLCETPLDLPSSGISSYLLLDVAAVLRRECGFLMHSLFPSLFSWKREQRFAIKFTDIFIRLRRWDNALRKSRKCV